MAGLPTARTRSVCLAGAEATIVTVEARFEVEEKKKTEVVLTGLPDAVLRESKARVFAALGANGVGLPSGRLVLHLAPAGLRKSGEALDLALALAAAASCGHVPRKGLERCLFLGELGIDGRLHDVAGGIAAAEAARRADIDVIVAPPRTASEAVCLPGSRVLAAPTLARVLAWVVTRDGLDEARPLAGPPTARTDASLDDVRGQAAGKRALEIAAAGGHGLLMLGPPGTGKSLLARGLRRLLPPPDLDERIEITRIASATGRPTGELATTRPFRAPHHTTSLPGLVGGGNPISAGEITLAHRGVLFLDELPEFRREVLEGLRQPLETGRVLIARAGRRTELPARFHLVAAMNPCPCGYRGHRLRTCACSPYEVRRYRRRISGPLLDRVDLRLELPSPDLAALATTTPDAEREPILRARVEAARARRTERQGAALPNAALAGDALDAHAPLDRPLRRLVERACEHRDLSARAIQSLRRVARTIADLADASDIGEAHLAEALALRAPLMTA